MIRPEPWVTEDGFIFFPITQDGTIYAEAQKFVNDTLEEWGYDARITWQEFLFGRCSVVVWVDPDAFDKERWLAEDVSYDPKRGWIKLFRVFMEDVDGW